MPTTVSEHVYQLEEQNAQLRQALRFMREQMEALSRTPRPLQPPAAEASSDPAATDRHSRSASASEEPHRRDTSPSSDRPARERESDRVREREREWDRLATADDGGGAAGAAGGSRQQQLEPPVGEMSAELAAFVARLQRALDETRRSKLELRASASKLQLRLQRANELRALAERERDAERTRATQLDYELRALTQSSATERTRAERLCRELEQQLMVNIQ